MTFQYCLPDSVKKDIGAVFFINSIFSYDKNKNLESYNSVISYGSEVTS